MIIHIYRSVQISGRRNDGTWANTQTIPWQHQALAEATDECSWPHIRCIFNPESLPGSLPVEIGCRARHRAADQPPGWCWFCSVLCANFGFHFRPSPVSIEMYTAYKNAEKDFPILFRGYCNFFGPFSKMFLKHSRWGKGLWKVLRHVHPSHLFNPVAGRQDRRHMGPHRAQRAVPGRQNWSVKRCGKWWICSQYQHRLELMGPKKAEASLFRFVLVSVDSPNRMLVMT